MRILLVRHAEAVGKGSFEGDDLDRPLTEEGAAQARRLARRLREFYGEVGRVLTSPARRARQTAEPLAEAFCVALEETDLLKPGATFEEFVKILHRYGGEEGAVVLVGHEPDFSAIVGQSVAGGGLAIKVGKLACVELEVEKSGRGELRALLPFRHLCA